jgi:hypothetical protein
LLFFAIGGCFHPLTRFTTLIDTAKASRLKVRPVMIFEQSSYEKTDGMIPQVKR